MFDAIIGFSLKNRALVLIAAIGLLAGGFFTAFRLPIDVFPDLNAPTVTLLTEAHGMAPEQVEALVTFPLESAVNGATGVRRVRSFSAPGISIVHVEFDWEMDVYAARQIVSEKLQAALGALPPDIPKPVMAPMASIMGEIMLALQRSLASFGRGKIWLYILVPALIAFVLMVGLSIGLLGYLIDSFIAQPPMSWVADWGAVWLAKALAALGELAGEVVEQQDARVAALLYFRQGYWQDVKYAAVGGPLPADADIAGRYAYAAQLAGRLGQVRDE